MENLDLKNLWVQYFMDHKLKVTLFVLEHPETKEQKRFIMVWDEMFDNDGNRFTAEQLIKHELPFLIDDAILIVAFFEKARREFEAAQITKKVEGEI